MDSCYKCPYRILLYFLGLVSLVSPINTLRRLIMGVREVEDFDNYRKACWLCFCWISGLFACDDTLIPYATELSCWSANSLYNHFHCISVLQRHPHSTTGLPNGALTSTSLPVSLLFAQHFIPFVTELSHWSPTCLYSPCQCTCVPQF